MIPMTPRLDHYFFPPLGILELWNKMPRRKNQKKVQDDSDEEIPQKPTVKQPEPITAPEEPPQPEPAQTTGASTSEEGKKDPTPPTNVLYCGGQ